MFRLFFLLLPLSLFAVDIANLIAQNPELVKQYQGELKEKPLQTQRVSTKAENVIVSADREENLTVTEADETKEQISEAKPRPALTPFAYRSNEELIDEILSEQIRHEGQKLSRYGDQFLRNQNSVDPAALPVPESYKINVGDELSIVLFGVKNDTLTAKVNHNGDLLLPEVGAVKIAGMPFGKARKQLEKMLQGAYLNTTAYVDMQTFSTMQVTVTGNIAAPGVYNLQSFSTLLDVLKVANGILETGTMRDIVLKRKGKVIARFDLYELIRDGKTDNNPFLRYGDVVIVGEIHEGVTLSGAVQTPARYELKAGETLKDLLRYAGGIKASGNSYGIKVKRFENNELLKVYTLGLEKAGSFVLQNGDKVFVREISDRESVAISLKGNVLNPGDRAISEGLTLGALLSSEIEAHGLKGVFLDNTEWHYGVIKRFSEDLESILLSFDLSKVLGGEEEIVLQASDEIYILNSSSLKENPYVFVEGDALASPSKLQYFSGLTLHDVYQSVPFRSEHLHEGVRHRVYPDRSHVKVERQDETGRKAFILDLDKNASFAMMPFDVVHILDYYTTHNLENVSINGEVEMPGTYAYEPGMRLQKLIDIAGSFTEKASGEMFEIVRYSVVDDERKREVLKFPVSKETLAQRLYPYDEVTFFRISKWSEKKSVTLRGEVKYPGTYVIEPGDRLSDVLVRAGGFTEDAFLEGALFTRESLKQQQKQQMDIQVSRLKQKAFYHSNSAEQFGELPQSKANLGSLAEQITQESEKFTPLGRISIKLERDLERFDASHSNIVLAANDTITIPQQNDTVFVFGEVLSSTTMIYDPDMDVGDYIASAGGMNEMADDESIYVIHADGTSERYSSGLFGHSVKIARGDTIIVPMRLDFISGWQMVKDAASILYQMSLTAAAWNTIVN